MEGLTEEQKERIARNRQRALEIRRKREEEAKGASVDASTTKRNNQTTATINNNNDTTQSNGEQSEQNETIKNDAMAKIRGNNNPPKQQDEEKEEEEELEDFEINAAPHVTKTEAMKVYCLPEGTLSVCNYIEKDNPKHGKWSKMKLYNRKDIRKRARQRFGGLDGLVKEREKRERKRFERDWDDVEAMNVFKRTK